MEGHRSERDSLIGIRSRGRFVHSDPVVVVVVVGGGTTCLNRLRRSDLFHIGVLDWETDGNLLVSHRLQNFAQTRGADFCRATQGGDVVAMIQSS